MPRINRIKVGRPVAAMLLLAFATLFVVACAGGGDTETSAAGPAADPASDAASSRTETAIADPASDAASSTTETAMADTASDAASTMETAMADPASDAASSTTETAMADPASDAASSSTETAMADPASDAASSTTETAMADPAPEAASSSTETAMADPASDAASSTTETAMVETESAPAPALLDTVDDFGFVLNLDLGADVRTAGWTEVEPDAMQGTLSYTASGVSTILIWGPQEARPPVTFLADTYNILRGSQPELNFDPISDGEITVSGEQGVYGGFRTIDASDATLGGGLIGTWVCSGPETAYRLTLTGEDAAVVQLRFDRLLDQFACAS